MREILFRGKTKDGTWYHGFIKGKSLPNFEGNKLEFTPCIIEQSYADIWVIPETVGQYTGLTDKNGTKIFEGDIVKHYCSSEDKTIFDVGQFYWCENICQFRRTSRTEGQFYDVNSSCEYEVIGNIHDNPELLKGGVQE